MSFLSTIFGSAAAAPIEAIGNIIDATFTSDDERLTHEEIKMRIAQQPARAAQEIGRVQAQHRSTFVAGGRPFIVWVCGTGLAYAWVVRPLVTDLSRFLGVTVEWMPMKTDNMIDLVIAILGLGALRTVEKINGKTM